MAASTAASAADAPGYFKLPGTETSMQIYGYAVLDAFYDMESGIGNFGTIIDAIHGAQTQGTVDGFAPDKQFTMTADRSRIGITTVSQTSMGEVRVKVEGDFLPGRFRLRHGYGTMGNWLAGKTWSTFFDLDASPETVDFTGGIGSSNFDTPRFPMLRYTVPFTSKVSLALAAEQDATGSTDSRRPSLIGALTYADGWGHIAARVLAQRYGTFVAQTPVTPEIRYSTNAVAWQLSGNLKLGSDNLQLAILHGNALGAYGAGFQSVINDLVDQRFEVWKSTGVTIGYAHVWSDMVRSNIVASGLKYKRNTLTAPTDIEKIHNYFLNTFITFTKNSELGIEYVYGVAQSFDSGALLKANGMTTDKIKESRLQAAWQYNFF